VAAKHRLLAENLAFKPKRAVYHPPLIGGQFYWTLGAGLLGFPRFSVGLITTGTAALDITFMSVLTHAVTP